MKQKLLKIMLTLAVYTEALDAFQNSVYVTMDSDTKDWKFQAVANARAVESFLQKLFWESVCCTVADFNAVFTSTAEIDIACAEFEGHFERRLLKEASGHSQWTPALSTHIETTAQQLQLELAEMLCRMAAAYYTGGAVEGVGEHYVFHLYR